MPTQTKKNKRAYVALSNAAYHALADIAEREEISVAALIRLATRNFICAQGVIHPTAKKTVAAMPTPCRRHPTHFFAKGYNTPW
jgi:hypothetical protein